MVPPSISIGGRGRWVSTNVGVWNGGFGPHQPFQSGSSCQPGGPNLLAPMISAPMPWLWRSAKASSTPAVPPASQNRVREHPLVQTFAGVAEGCLGGLRLAGGEAVERDGQVVDPGE